MKKKITIFILVLLIVLLLLFSWAFFFRGRVLGLRLFEKYDSFGCSLTSGYKWCDAYQKCLHPDITECPNFKTTYEERELVRRYLNEHISELSPEKEVLGGKFFIGDFNFEGGNKVAIDYEDGHNLFRADVIFKVDEQKGTVEIESFEIVRKN